MHDVFTHKFKVCLVLEYCVTDLESIVRSKSTILQTADIKSYLRMALEGLSCCHEQWILHRDLKPNNLFVGIDHQLKLGLPILNFSKVGLTCFS
jgi:cyclin-dependent kinase 7